MSFPKYPAYKESGVEWIGEVPGHWEPWKLSHAFESIGSGTTPPSTETQWYEGGSTPWVTTGELRESMVTETAKCVTDTALKQFTALRVHPAGSLVIAMYGATIGRLGILGVNATTNQACCALSKSKAITVAFAYYWLQGFKQVVIDLFSSGGGQPNISQEVVSSLRIPAPGMQEQRQITDFLDRETAKIDALVAEQEQFITLLKEKRQAVISHAVTKGLDPSVPMKDSGVEWLGEVPAHWTLRPLKAVVTFRSGGTPDKRNAEYWDGEVPWVSAKDLKVARLADSIDHITQFALDDGAAVLVPERGVVVVVRGMILARLFPVTQLMRPMAINQDLKALVPRSELAADYLAWLLRASEPETLNCLDEAGHGTKALRMENWEGMAVPVPPIAEQQAIAAEMDAVTVRHDQLIHEAFLSIELLRERRSALISAAVTGQIDVRGLAPAQEQAA